MLDFNRLAKWGYMACDTIGLIDLTKIYEQSKSLLKIDKQSKSR